eukprot:CAMPEP_0198316390 /NCGR_PEP_ID=MMETSP1450-20131203/6302_1 /TAXON_ID=753684 ORGANISM="Madagascaria erythrocladiodes, Strain CCMP3234" /NCGR_SAMPLE_ID=MMETSP1450 /ASSEMBLY_ACC=CAM_ASM_001115 /LENGTH=133 /DNA_ID=CAMNT_0044019543 /DNA_START=68 /DNA_END=466 /DNA_ORIENTATION=-
MIAATLAVLSLALTAAMEGSGAYWFCMAHKLRVKSPAAFFAATPMSQYVPLPKEISLLFVGIDLDVPAQRTMVGIIAAALTMLTVCNVAALFWTRSRATVLGVSALYHFGVVAYAAVDLPPVAPVDLVLSPHS